MGKSKNVMISMGAMLLMVAGSVWGTAESGASSGAYQIGFTNSLSGAVATYGVGANAGFTAYINYVNKHGGVETIKRERVKTVKNGHVKYIIRDVVTARHQINVTTLDDASLVTTGITNEQELIADGVSAVAGSISSGVCNAQAAIATAQDVPLICSGISQSFINPAEPYVFVSRQTGQDEATPMVNFAGTLLKTSATHNVAIAYQSSPATIGWAQAVAALVAAKGWTVVSTVTVASGTTDTSAQVAQIAASKPDVVIAQMPDAFNVAFVRGLIAAGVKVPYIDYDGASISGSILPLIDPNMYVLSSTTLNGQGPGAGLKIYRAALAADGVDAADIFVNVGYTQAEEVVASLQRCGYPCSGTKMNNAMNHLNLNTKGVNSGNLVWTSTNHEALNHVGFYHWDISTDQVARAGAIYVTGSQ